jgi:uncharacterized protein YbjQ (UPF0145 family)
MSWSAPQDVDRPGVERTVHVLVTTGNEIAGRSIVDYLGVVRGIVVRVPTRRQWIRGSFEAQFEGGNNPYVLELAEGARSDAYDEMVEHAKSLGADAIVAVRYQTTPCEAASSPRRGRRARFSSRRHPAPEEEVPVGEENAIVAVALGVMLLVVL